jgi:hypothetical protein
MKSQNDQVLHALKSGPITAKYAAIKLHIWRLASRIKDLRDIGHEIHTEMITTSDGKRYARYHLLKVEKHGTGIST